METHPKINLAGLSFVDKVFSDAIPSFKHGPRDNEEEEKEEKEAHRILVNIREIPTREIEAHVSYLIKKRSTEFEGEYAARKKIESTDDIRQVMCFRVVPYKETRWTCSYLYDEEMLLTTLDATISLVLWIWACRLVIDACRMTICGISTRRVSDSDVLEGNDMMKKAQGIFLFLTQRGTKEGWANHTHRAPFFTKAYVCRAYEVLTFGLRYVIKASRLIASPTKTNIVQSVALHLNMACDALSAACEILKNENGVDACPPHMHLSLFELYVIVRAFSVYYTGRFHVVNQAHRETALKYMRTASTFARIEESERRSMNNAISTYANMLSDSQSSYAFMRGLVEAVGDIVTSMSDEQIKTGTMQELVVFNRDVSELPPLPLATGKIDDLPTYSFTSFVFQNSSSNTQSK